VAASGCREYIGGAGRNRVTVFSDNFEASDALSKFDVQPSAGSATVSPSNESLAAGGHSLRTSLVDANAGVQTEEGVFAAFIDPASPKTYFLDFWAKGSGTLEAKMVNRIRQEDDTFVDGVPVLDFSDEPVALTGDWKKYTLGPVETAATPFGDNTILRLSGAASGSIFYIDNLSLRQTMDTITVIKNSWVVDAACDETPEGIPSPQYYLGCEAYNSSATGERETYHQFNRLCSENKVGCKQFFDTQNSESEYAQVFQARCHVSDTDPNAVASAVTACQYNGETVCTIGVGRSYCIFNLDQDINPATVPGNIKLGAEFARVSNDTPVYLVDNGEGQCGREQMGCEEMGRPVWSQDKSRVNSFESVALLNLPDEYASTLCEEEALFCEEWATTLDGNFYFKDPDNKSCEWKTGVTLSGRQTSGWFRTGTNEPCYWTDQDPSGSEEPASGSAEPS